MRGRTVEQLPGFISPPGCWASCRRQTLPAQLTFRKAGPKATHNLQLQTLPKSLGNSHGAKTQKTGMFPGSFPCAIHCAEASSSSSMQSPPASRSHVCTLFLPCFLSVPSALIYLLPNTGGLNSFSWKIPQQKEIWISHRLAKVTQFYSFFYCKSTNPEDLGARSAYSRDTLQHFIGVECLPV